MNVLLLLVFVSLVLAGSAVGLFVWTVSQQTFRHSSRLVLLPLEDEESSEPASREVSDGESE